jgi:hypothetical protein
MRRGARLFLKEAVLDLQRRLCAVMKRCVIEAIEGGERAALAHASVMRQHTSAYVGIRQHTSAYVSILRHTPAYAIEAVKGGEHAALAHASAFVSIRQHTHTSAYVSIR